MATGVIRWFNDLRGYGFIEPDDDETREPVYVHHTAIMGRGYRSLQPGQTVRYEIRRSGGHQQAIDVEVL